MFIVLELDKPYNLCHWDNFIGSGCAQWSKRGVQNPQFWGTIAKIWLFTVPRQTLSKDFVKFHIHLWAILLREWHTNGTNLDLASHG